jgi:hypothetical protein
VDDDEMDEWSFFCGMVIDCFDGFFLFFWFWLGFLKSSGWTFPDIVRDEISNDPSPYMTYFFEDSKRTFPKKTTQINFMDLYFTQRHPGYTIVFLGNVRFIMTVSHLQTLGWINRCDL